MIEDRHGYLWMGTQGGGLNRFDGLNFETFTAKDGLVDNYINVIYEANGKLYLGGARNGMSIFDGSSFQNYFVSKEENIQVTAFQEYQGKLLVGTNQGVYVFDGETFKYAPLYNRAKGKRTNCFFIDSRQRLWIGTKTGAILLDGKDRKTFRSSENFTKGEVTSICEDQKGNIWFATYNGAFKYDGQNFSQLSIEDGIASNFLSDILCNRDGLIWIATQDRGISIWNPVDSTITALNAETGLCNDNVRVIHEGSWGSTWIATSGGGICKYTGQQFLHLNISDRPADNLVYALSQDTAGTMWFAAADDGVVRLDSAGYTRFGKAEGFTNSKTKAMLRDSKGRMWLGTNDQGLAYFNGRSFEFLRYKGRALGRLCKDIVEDKDGAIWLGSSDEGIYKIVPKDSLIQLEEISTDSFYLNDSLIIRQDTLIKDSIVFAYTVSKIESIKRNVNALHFDQLGRLWFASRVDGVGFLEKGNVSYYNKRTGLPSNAIRSITEDDKGHLWIGTAGYGITRMNIYTDSLNLKNYAERDGLSSDNIYLLEFDNNGDLWVGCGRGVDRLTLDEEQNIKSIKAFRKADGFLGGETCQNAVLKDDQGSLWFGTIAGVTKFLPGIKRINETPPKLQITGVELFFQPFKQTTYKDWIDENNIFKKGLELPYRQNNLGFEFIGTNLANPKKVLYEWMLEGSDQNWSKRSAQNSVNYSSLSPGDYIFKVRAYNEDLYFNDPPLAMAFRIKKPIWQEWWFILGVLILCSGIPALFFKYRLNQVRQKAKLQQEQLELENNLLQLEQKALQLQMNPHFIFNALNTVQSLFMSQEQDAARLLLSKFAKLMRAILENSRESSIPLQKEMDLLDNYLGIEQFSRSNKFSYHIEVDTAIDTDEVNIPPMMIQPFVENAIIHGVNHLKSGGMIQVLFEKDGTELICTVQDNGIGRVASEKLNAQNARKHKSVALQVTKERLEFLNQHSQNKSLIINDLKAADGSPAGTEVLIRLPLEEW